METNNKKIMITFGDANYNGAVEQMKDYINQNDQNNLSVNQIDNMIVYALKPVFKSIEDAKKLLSIEQALQVQKMFNDALSALKNEIKGIYQNQEQVNKLIDSKLNPLKSWLEEHGKTLTPEQIAQVKDTIKLMIEDKGTIYDVGKVIDFWQRLAHSMGNGKSAKLLGNVPANFLDSEVSSDNDYVNVPLNIISKDYNEYSDAGVFIYFIDEKGNSLIINNLVMRKGLQGQDLLHIKVQ